MIRYSYNFMLRILNTQNNHATLSIGRHPQHNEIVLRDPNLSRVHCQVEVAENGVVLSDFESESGTERAT